ncbi:Hypothetical predicted protein [Cloeon dipterum]|uniref:Uncharacterized protein n=1 Tax=Cloeon dipterum TaxID=197152 RepID=A0A8S1BVJ9_9INSE|nr:Hypothetical predicted protein [Cloeon dipterum]
MYICIIHRRWDSASVRHRNYHYRPSQRTASTGDDASTASCARPAPLFTPYAPQAAPIRADLRYKNM